jgi:hypothetical protein
MKKGHAHVPEMYYVRKYVFYNRSAITPASGAGDIDRELTHRRRGAGTTVRDINGQRRRLTAFRAEDVPLLSAVGGRWGTRQATQ